MATRTNRMIEVRSAEPSDRHAVLELLATSLGWSAREPFDSFFNWKHEQNPFGRSPAWVAVDDGVVVGFRTFLRWEHRAPVGRVLRTVRAVDTATHPSYQGRGLFRRLTLQALDDLRTDGIAFVFNTPNDKSRPGYLKMGWAQVGRLTVTARVLSPVGLGRMAHARVPADLWSAPTTGGRAAAEVLAQPGLADLVSSVVAPSGLHTSYTPRYLRWRYGFGPLAYRVVTLDDDVRGGLAVFRIRRRGPAHECVLCEVLAPEGDSAICRALVRTALRQCGADYVVRLGWRILDRDGFVRVPRQGPVLTWYPLARDMPGAWLQAWSPSLGDVELF